MAECGAADPRGEQSVRDALGRVRSILVLGGGSEIALATTRTLVGRGGRRVVLAGRALDRTAAGAVAELRRLGGDVSTLEFDAADAGSHAAVIGAAFADGDIDLVLVAFGVLGDQDAFDHDPVAAAAAVTVNYVGAVSSGLAVAERFRAQGHGTLVVLSSVAGVRARRTNYVYGSSKAGLDAFAQGLDDALAGTGGRVLIVRPGFVRSRMTEGMEPQPLATTPDAVADAIVAGLEADASVVWVPRALRYVFGVLRVLPRPLWRLVSSR
jgi:decaprenylphospho-beta-D-erythro-pentofuranosid-2-ulose 2-reductase